MSISRSYGRGAWLLSIGIGSTGVVTFSYFALASRALDDSDYGRIALLWAVLFSVVTVLYRPTEQLLSRDIAAGRQGVIRPGLIIQGTLVVLFLAAVLILRDPIELGLFAGETALYWILVAGVIAYSASYFARGWLAGHKHFGIYGGLVFLEASSRALFALAAAVGVTSGQDAVAIGIVAAPLVSLVIVPLAFLRRAARRSITGGNRFGPGGRFAAAGIAIMLAEQALLNGAVVTAHWTSGEVSAGFVFNSFLVVRAPLQMFQAIQGSLLPHLAALHVDGAGQEEFRRAVRLTVLMIAALAIALSVSLALIGPWGMDVLFESAYSYGRGGLVLIALGLGAHLTSLTVNQAAFARDRAAPAAVAWVLSASAFVCWMVLSPVEDQVLRAELGYFGAATTLCAMLLTLHRRHLG